MQKFLQGRTQPGNRLTRPRDPPSFFQDRIPGPAALLGFQAGHRRGRLAAQVCLHHKLTGFKKAT